MFLLREPIWWVLLSGAIGYFCGWGKGRPGVGLLLGLVFGPFGCLAIMLLPAAQRGRMSGASGSARAAGPGDPACPRCGNAVARSARVCPQCGNVLMSIRYTVDA